MVDLYNPSLLPPDTHPLPQGWEPRPWQGECSALFTDRFNSTKDQLRFHLYAGTGSGKTMLAAYIANRLLSRRLIERLVFVVPNLLIASDVMRVFASFGINLVHWNNRRGLRNETPLTHGVIITYHSLASRPELQRQICQAKRTFVILDEVHHLGDELHWGLAVEGAFAAHARAILTMSGSPFRLDELRIPLVNYDPAGADGLLRFRPDYAYTLGDAIHDGVCKEPCFDWLDGDVSVPGRGTFRLTSDVSDELRGQLLRGFVAPDSLSRMDALESALRLCRDQDRRLIIFLGGDTSSDTYAIEDAEEILPEQLRRLGLHPNDYVAVTSRHGHGRITQFRNSRARALGTVSMVSEGVDLPELSAALFLSVITSPVSFIQRLGRILRGNTPATGLTLLPQVPALVTLAEQIKQETAHAARLRPRRKPREPGEGRGGAAPQCVGLNAALNGKTLNGHTYTAAQVESARAEMSRVGRPNTDLWLTVTLEHLRETAWK
jgi:superfamily II DNA or RNA helicase